MPERPYSRYTRAKIWAALYSQHINAGYALVPYSATNNSIAVIRCGEPEEVQKKVKVLYAHAEECAAYYSQRPPPEKTPAFLEKARHAVVLARSSDYHHYHLADHLDFRLVICGLHDSYLHVPVWETRTNQRYAPRQTAIDIASSDFHRLRRTSFGHNILVGALIHKDQTAQAFFKTLPKRTQRRINQKVEALQEARYRGRPLAFLNDAKRLEIGTKIREGLRRYYAQKREATI